MDGCKEYKNILNFLEVVKRVRCCDRTPTISDEELDNLIAQAKIAKDFLDQKAYTEKCLADVKRGASLWFVDYEEGEIEEAVVQNVHYADGSNVHYAKGSIDSFSVDFKETGDFDEFYGEALGDNFFLSEEEAKCALINGHGMKG